VVPCQRSSSAQAAQVKQSSSRFSPRQILAFSLVPNDVNQNCLIIRQNFFSSSGFRNRIQKTKNIWRKYPAAKTILFSVLSGVSAGFFSSIIDIIVNATKHFFCRFLPSKNDNIKMVANKGVPPQAEAYVKAVDEFMAKYPTVTLYGTSRGPDVGRSVGLCRNSTRGYNDGELDVLDGLCW
jgi:hypothetical protein